jgi:hypothetical protein
MPTTNETFDRVPISYYLQLSESENALEDLFYIVLENDLHTSKNLAAKNCKHEKMLRTKMKKFLSSYKELRVALKKVSKDSQKS